MRAIWSGSIGFGLVNIPVKLFSATLDSTLDLDMLDTHGHANIRYARINSSTGKEVPWSNIVKGYKYHDNYVVLTDEDFEKASPRKSKMIDINEFVKEEDIDTTYYDTPYYLEPSKGGEKAYVLLREALKQSGKVAVGQYIMRTKENLCLLKPQDDVILLLKIRFAEEIRDYEELNIPKDLTVKPAELKMAQTLINQLTPKKFSMAKYKDTYDEALMKIIVAKSKGKKIVQPRFKIVHNKSKDLMSQLKASLENGTKKKSIMSLTKYKSKRHFSDTPEPKGKISVAKTKLTFVVQRHHASQLHYDFRLELNGTLKSWAVPKGPSLNPKDKRLAMMVEDHPIDYATFEGDIPAGNYGAGHVDVWDHGTYEPIDEKGEAITSKEFSAHLHAGSIKFRMKGKLLKGDFALVNMKKDDKTWLLIKHRDQYATDEDYNSEDYAKKSSLAYTAERNKNKGVKKK